MLRQKERKYSCEFLDELDNLNTENPKEFWDKIKSLDSKKKCDIPLSVYKNGSMSYDINDVTNEWTDKFSKLYNNNSCNFDDQFLEVVKKHNQTEELSNHQENSMINNDIRIEEITKHINKAKCKKSPGIDHIPNEVLKYDNVKLVLYHLFKFCFTNSIVPKAWLRAIIVPIPKGSDKDPCMPLSYRGISLLPCISKIYTSILNSRITNYLENNNLLCKEQFGFRKGKSCEQHVFNLSSIIKCRMDKNKDTFVGFIDMAKAFDNVNRDLLYYKLLRLNINGKIYKAVKSLYSNTFNCIRLNNIFTNWFYSNSGVRQGDSLSPTLFSIYINDLANELNNLQLGITIDDIHLCILLYADDIALISDSEIKLQGMLDYVNNWSYKWRISLNVQKSAVVHFRKTRKTQTDFEFKVGNDILQIVDKYVYLGIVFDKHLNFKECAETLCCSAGRALGKIIGKFKTFENVNYKTYTKLYDTCVWPILDYCSSIWSHCNHLKSDNIQNRAIRYHLGLHKNAPILALQSEMGWLTPKYKYYKSCIRLWNKIVSMHQDCITRKIFEHNFKNIVNNNSWSSHMFNIFEELNLIDSFCNLETVDLSYIDECLSDTLENEWSANLINKPKLRTFVLFKEHFETEDYVKINCSKYKRSLLAQLRIGILPLEIETGRYYRINPENRICKLCKKYVEDEFHFICVCENLQSVRNKYYTFENVNLNVFTNIMQNMNPRKLVNLVFELWQTRCNLLFN